MTFIHNTSFRSFPASAKPAFFETIHRLYASFAKPGRWLRPTAPVQLKSPGGGAKVPARDEGRGDRGTGAQGWALRH